MYHCIRYRKKLQLTGKRRRPAGLERETLHFEGRGAVKNEQMYGVGSWPKDLLKNVIVERTDPIIYRLYFCALIT